MSAAKNTGREKIKADIVIIGGGAAGLAAAAAAAEAGVKDVVLLEGKASLGGNGIFPLGIFGAGSRFQADRAVDADLEYQYRLAMDYGQWKTDARMLRALIEKSGDTIGWLEGMGVVFDRLTHHFPNQAPEVYHVVAPPQNTGGAVMKALEGYCKKAGVKALTRTHGQRILAGKGGISGVLAAGRDGETEIGTGCVILATGGFAGNKAMLKKYFPRFNFDEVLHLMGIRHKGDGMRMALEMGAGPDDEFVLEMGAPKMPGPPLISVLISKPYPIWVNRNGERFADEGIVFLFSESANAFCRQPDKVGYILLDQTVKQAIVGGALDPLEQVTLMGQPWPEGLDEDLRKQDGKLAKTAGSWKEIAAWIGAGAGVLEATVAEYNASCARGYDHALGKERRFLVPLTTPPYIAVKSGVDLLATHGGIKANYRMEVLTERGRPIRGLYAGGVDLGGIDAGSYNLKLSGHAFGFSVNSGRIAGENAARFVLGQHG